MIVAGIGFNTRATPAALAKAVDTAILAAGGARLDALASAWSKSADPVLIAFAQTRALPLLVVNVAGIQTPSQSPRVLALFGTGSLAEAAALAGAGPNARLLATKCTSPCGRATAAIAQSKDITE
jgi:cobalt-precorrin 5A hydrolase